MDLKLFFIFLPLLISNLDQKTFVFVHGKSIALPPHGNIPQPLEKKLLDRAGAELLVGLLNQSSDNEYPNGDETGSEVSLEDVHDILSNISTDIRHQMEVVQNARAYLIAIKEKLERQLAKSRNKEQTELVVVTETNFNTGKIIDLSPNDSDYETDQTAVTTFPSSSENDTFEAPSEIEKTSETLLSSSFYNDMERSAKLFLEDGNLTPDINIKEFRFILTTEPSLSAASNINEFSIEYTKLTNNTPTKIRKTADVITERAKDYPTRIHPTAVKIQSFEREVKSLGYPRTSDRFKVITIPKVISSTEKVLIRPDHSSVSPNVVSFQNTSTDQYSATFSSIGQTDDLSSADKSEHSESKILETVLEQRKNDVKNTTLDAKGYNFLFNSIVADVLERLIFRVFRSNGGLLEEINSIDLQLFIEEMENDLPLDYLEVFEDIMDLFRLNTLLEIHKQSNDGTFFYHNTGNSSMP